MNLSGHFFPLLLILDLLLVRRVSSCDKTFPPPSITGVSACPNTRARAPSLCQSARRRGSCLILLYAGKKENMFYISDKYGGGTISLHFFFLSSKARMNDFVCLQINPLQRVAEYCSVTLEIFVLGGSFKTSRTISM